MYIRAIYTVKSLQLLGGSCQFVIDSNPEFIKDLGHLERVPQPQELRTY